MKRIFTFAIACMFIVHANAQKVETVEEINIKSKEFLIAKDYKSALPLFKQAAELGSAEAQYNYGVCFQMGIIVEKNEKTAMEWFSKSALGGYKDAQYQLALNFTTGNVVAKDEKKAFYWWHKCASQMDPECMSNLINCYKDGIGTNRNVDSMMYWAHKLASLDAPPNYREINMQIATIRLNLARSYYTGSMVPKDLTKSYTWFLVYNERKNEFPAEVQAKNISLIKEIEAKLSDAERKKAKTEAERILKRPLSKVGKIHEQES